MYLAKIMLIIRFKYVVFGKSCKEIRINAMMTNQAEDFDTTSGLKNRNRVRKSLKKLSSPYDKRSCVR